MSTHGLTVGREGTTLPSGIESPRAKLVYLYLWTVPDATIEELASGLDVTKISLYGVLRALDERGFVERHGDRYVAADSVGNADV